MCVLLFFFFFSLCSIKNRKNEGWLYFWLNKSNVSHACITRSCFSVCQKGLATLEMLSGDFSLKKIQFSSVTNTRLYQTLGYEKHSVISNTWLWETLGYIKHLVKTNNVLWMFGKMPKSVTYYLNGPYVYRISAYKRTSWLLSSISTKH